MNRSAFALAAVLAAALLLPAVARAQSAAAYLEAARAQIEDVNPDSAAGLAIRALDRRAGASNADQVRGWVLLGIAELMRNRPLVARQAFRRALERDGTTRVDSLAHLHSDLRALFGAERDTWRLETNAESELTLAIRAPDTTVNALQGRYNFELRPRRRARVVFSITPAGNDLADPIYADTLTAANVAIGTWDFARGAGVQPGRYVIRAAAIDASGRTSPTVTRTLNLFRASVDTLRGPMLPDDSLLPETELGRKPSSLIGGLALGAGAVVLASALGNKELGGSGDAARFVVAGGISAAAIVGFLRGRESREIPSNMAYNQDLKERYDAMHGDMSAENRRRLASAPMRIRVEGQR